MRARGRADVCLRRPPFWLRAVLPSPTPGLGGHLPWVWPAVDPGQQPCSRRDWGASVGPFSLAHPSLRRPPTPDFPPSSAARPRSFLSPRAANYRCPDATVGQRAAGHRRAHVTWLSLGTEARTPDPTRAARLSAVSRSEAGPRALSAVAEAALSPGAAYLGPRRVWVPQFWMTAPGTSFGP